MKPILATTLVFAAASSLAVAQRKPLATAVGLEVGLQFARYHYEEPEFARLVGPRVGLVGAYTLGRRGMFLKADGRVSLGRLEYDGSGTQDGVPDRITETRVVVGANIRAAGWLIFSPYAGRGSRHLFNDRGGTQLSRLSDGMLGRADVTAEQRTGRGYRLGLVVEHRGFIFGPWIHRWKIADSELVTLDRTAIGVEPANWTREFGLEARYRLGPKSNRLRRQIPKPDTRTLRDQRGAPRGPQTRGAAAQSTRNVMQVPGAGVRGKPLRDEHRGCGDLGLGRRIVRRSLCLQG